MGFGLDRDRSFYPTVLIVVGSYYSLFAVMGASAGTLWAEIAMGLGFRGRGVDRVPKAPLAAWWLGLCGSIDGVMGVWLGVLALKRRKTVPAKIRV